jgi:hypothetical protein
VVISTVFFYRVPARTTPGAENIFRMQSECVFVGALKAVECFAPW